MSDDPNKSDSVILLPGLPMRDLGMSTFTLSNTPTDRFSGTMGDFYYDIATRTLYERRDGQYLTIDRKFYVDPFHSKED